MYSLKCNYYNKCFNTLEQLINDVLNSGQDPNYEITFNGQPTGEILFNLMYV